MSLPASAKKRDVVRALTTKGFQEEKSSKRRPHRTFWHLHEGRVFKGIRTEVKKSSDNEIPRFLLKKMARQCRLLPADFHDFINCDLTEDDYRRRVVAALKTWPPRWHAGTVLPAIQTATNSR